MQVFDGNFMDQLLLNDDTEIPSGYLQAKYCGTVFDNIQSKNNIVYVRYYAEKQAIQKGIEFEATFTAMRNLDSTDKTDLCGEVKNYI